MRQTLGAAVAARPERSFLLPGSKYEIYIQSFPRAGTKVRVSTNGGTQPRWRGDGQELYYLAGGTLTAVDVRVTGAGEVTIGTGHPIADGLILSPAINDTQAERGYAVTKAGRGFLLLFIPPTETQDAPMTFVVNWPALLKK